MSKEKSPGRDLPANLYELLSARVEQNPDKTFLFSEVDGRSFTYTDFRIAVDHTAALLAGKDIKKGDVVSLLMPNSAEYIIAYFACFRLGAIAGPVNSLLKTQEIAFVMGNSEARAALVGSEFRPGLDEIAGNLPQLQHVITFDSVTAATAGIESADS